MGITEFIVEYATLITETTGHLGIGLLMTLESMVFPVPSEAVMPFAGFLWNEGKLTFLAIILSSTIGSLIGSLISYYIGAYAGRPFVMKFGKYLLLNEEHLVKTEKFFSRYGDKTIFFSRFIPVVRHLISIPAGIGRMKLGKFCLYTIIGAGIWNAFLAWVGFQLKDNWESIRHYTEILDIILVVGIVASIVYFIYKQLKNRRTRRPDVNSEMSDS